MDCDFNAATERLSATVFMLSIDMAVAYGEDPGDDHIVIMRRFGAAMVAAEKMADAIEAYDAASERALDDETASDEAAALVAAIESAIRFRQAMRGEV